MPFSDVQDGEPPDESESGSFWLLVGAGCGAAEVWGVAYAALHLWSGFIILFIGILLPILAGGLVAATVVQISKRLRIPHSRTTIWVCVVCGFLGWYTHWVAWLALASEGEVIAIFPWDVARVLYLVATEAPLEFWIFTTPVRVTAAERYVLWGFEAVFWVGAAWGVGSVHWSIGQVLLGIYRVSVGRFASHDDVQWRRRS